MTWRAGGAPGPCSSIGESSAGSGGIIPRSGQGSTAPSRRSPYVFSRTLEAEGTSDRVLVAMDQGEGEKTIPVFGLFPDGTGLVDAYSGATATVTEGSVTLTTGSDLVLLSRPSPSAAPAGP